MRIIIGDSSPPSDSTMSSFGSVEEIVDVADGILGEGLVDDVLEGSVLVAARCGAFEVPARDGDVGDGARALARAHPRWGGVNADLDVVLDVRGVGLGESRHAGVEGDGRAFVTVDEAVRVEDTPEVLEGLLAPDFAPGAGREILRRRELTHDPFRGTFLNQGPPKRGAVEKGRHAWTRYAGEMDARCVRLILRGGEKSVRKRRRRREHARVRTGRGMFRKSASSTRQICSLSEFDARCIGRRSGRTAHLGAIRGIDRYEPSPRNRFADEREHDPRSTLHGAGKNGQKQRSNFPTLGVTRVPSEESHGYLHSKKCRRFSVWRYFQKSISLKLPMSILNRRG